MNKKTKSKKDNSKNILDKIILSIIMTILIAIVMLVAYSRFMHYYLNKLIDNIDSLENQNCKITINRQMDITSYGTTSVSKSINEWNIKEGMIKVVNKNNAQEVISTVYYDKDNALTYFLTPVGMLIQQGYGKEFGMLGTYKMNIGEQVTEIAPYVIEKNDFMQNLRLLISRIAIISPTTLDGVPCTRITLPFDSTNAVYYVDNNGLIIKLITYNKYEFGGNNIQESVTTLDFKYEKGVVTDKDIAIPDYSDKPVTITQNY